MKNYLVYDLEIIKAVPEKGGVKPLEAEGIQYCDGWHDHQNMGISVIGAYDSKDDRYRVFCADNFKEFFELADARDVLVSFNGIGFDNKVLLAAGVFRQIDIEADFVFYDILAELWNANGLRREFTYPTHIGFGLDAVAMANFGQKKSGNGALAPVEWQQGKIGSVIDYCLNDVKLTKRLFDRILETGGLRDPREPGRFMEMKRPE